MNSRLIRLVPGIEGEELMYVQNLTKDLTDEQVETFASIYNGKRKKSETTLIAALLGFFGVAGLQRFLLDQIIIGIMYLLTAGLCFIGTIVDIVNYKKLTFEYNQSAAHESLQLMSSLEA